LTHDSDDPVKPWLETVADHLNADSNRNLSSWAEYYEPRAINGGLFSLTERYDFANPVFDAMSFDGWGPIDYTDESQNRRHETPLA
jgi:hypothetical protein